MKGQDSKTNQGREVFWDHVEFLEYGWWRNKRVAHSMNETFSSSITIAKFGDE
jgi:hypothetical protein